MNCPSCGNRIPNKAKFCKVCEFNLENYFIGDAGAKTEILLNNVRSISGLGETSKIYRSGVELVKIPSGSFIMGSEKCWSEENPRHRVGITGFWMQKTPVTQSQYEKVMGENPSKFKGKDHPVEQIDWKDAVKFCNKLSELCGLDSCYNLKSWECDFKLNGFRLPTEAEWEYACRAGTTTEYYTGNEESDLSRAGWYIKNSNERTHRVGELEPNSWGLYDMHGNVWEWCHDWFDSDYYSKSSNQDPTGSLSGEHHTKRGGCWNVTYYCCYSASRFDFDPYYWDCYIGFRVVRR